MTQAKLADELGVLRSCAPDGLTLARFAKASIDGVPLLEARKAGVTTGGAQPRSRACRHAYLAGCILIAAWGLIIAPLDSPAAASSVSSVSAILSTTASATGVQYTVTFTTPSALSAGGSFGA